MADRWLTCTGKKSLKCKRWGKQLISGEFAIHPV